MRFAWILLLPALVACNHHGPSLGTNHAEPMASQDGASLFVANCAVCHGEAGKGDGPAAPFLFPKPRDLTRASYKIRTTAGGELPTDEDLFRAITNGLPGSAMPSFAHLSEQDRRKLVEYVKSLAVVEIGGQVKNLFEHRGKPRVIVPPAPPKLTDALLSEGRRLYREKGCAQCHGEQGLGDGPSALTLRDDLGYPIPPNNFRRGIFKGGGTVQDIYLRFTTGMNGTPMPSFEETLKDEERWALAYYVKSLAGEKVAVQPSERQITVKRVDGDLPMDPEAAVYRQGPATDVPLMLLWQRQQAADVLTVRAVHNGRELGLLLEWEDLTANGSFLRPQDFTDGVAVQFPVTESKPQFTMGDKDHPVNIWHWRFDRQLDVAGFRDVEQHYAGMVADDYQFESTHYPKSKEKASHLPITPAPSHDPTYLTGWGAGNTLSNPNLRSPCQSLVARGFGTLEPIPESAQQVLGRGIWRHGRWVVVLVRPLTTGSRLEAQLSPGQSTYAAFAVWDGERGDRDGQKLVSYWQRLVLEK